MNVVGIDEVGRGCWAGPVVAGAVLLAQPIPGLKDSKLLSKKRREELAMQIKEQAIVWGLGWVDAATIDKVGINTAVKMSMIRAVAKMGATYMERRISGEKLLPDAHVPESTLRFGARFSSRTAPSHVTRSSLFGIDEIIVDGNINYLANEPRARALIKADMTVPAVSAASILAKVARDQYMTEAAKTFRGYGFEAHVGYGTALHMAALRDQGICELHRTSYKPIRAIIEATA